MNKKERKLECMGGSRISGRGGGGFRCVEGGGGGSFADFISFFLNIP